MQSVLAPPEQVAQAASQAERVREGSLLVQPEPVLNWLVEEQVVTQLAPDC